MQIQTFWIHRNSNAAIFIRTIQMLLQPIRKFTVLYIDDISVYSRAWCSHLMTLEKFVRNKKVQNYAESDQM